MRTIPELMTSYTIRNNCEWVNSFGAGASAKGCIYPIDIAVEVGDIVHVT
jgi:hypothetical protein